MRRKLSLLFSLVLAMSVAAACATPSGLSRDDDETPSDSTGLCGVVGGSQTLCCEEEESNSNLTALGSTKLKGSKGGAVAMNGEEEEPCELPPNP